MDILAIINRYEAVLIERKIKKGDFYKACGISGAAVSQWRTGKTKPSYDTLERMASALGMSFDELVFGKQQEMQVDATKDASKSNVYGAIDVDTEKIALAISKAHAAIVENEKKRKKERAAKENEAIDLFRSIPDEKKEVALVFLRTLASSEKVI